MSVSLDWLLSQHRLALRLLTGQPSAARPITWAHAIELDDPSPWLDGGELIMTTGLRLPRAAAAQRAYIERLARADAAAVAFGVGLRFTEVPPALVEGCRDVGLPLLEVPLPTPFVAIAQAVGARLAEQQRDSLQGAVDFQRRLTRAAFQEGVAGLVAALAAELRCEALLAGEHLDVVAAAHASPRMREEVRARVTELAEGTARSVISVADESGTLVVHRISGRQALRGWLAVRSQRRLDAHDRLLLNQVVSLLALQLDRPRELEQAREELAASVLALVLDGSQEAAAQLRHFGFRDTEPLSALVATAERDPLPQPALRRAVVGLSCPEVGLARSEREYVLVVPAKSQDAALEAVTRALAGADGCAVGAAGPVAAAQLSAGVASARRVAAAARWDGRTFSSTDALTAILDDPDVRARIRAVSSTVLTPLSAAASRGDQALERSLTAFLRHHGSWEAAARAAGVHRHTMRHHIERVQELTGLDLSLATTRAALLLALLAEPAEERDNGA